MSIESNPPAGKGIRTLKLNDIAPDCPILINRPLYKLEEIAKGRNVLDIGCGYGRFKPIVESAGGTWTGVEPFEGGAATVKGDAENLPLEGNSYDVAIMHAVLEHIPDVSKAFAEVSRVLKPGGILIGYSAFMECFHEISYSHLSFKALEHYAQINGMKLEKIAGGGSFGIDYHLAVLVHPLPFKLIRGVLASSIRALLRVKSALVYCTVRFRRHEGHAEAARMSHLYYQVECLRQSNGFEFIIRKLPLMP